MPFFYLFINIQGKCSSVDYSTFISIILTCLSVLLTALTVVIGVVAWYTISSIKKSAKRIAKEVASEAVVAELKKLEKKIIIPFIEVTVVAKVDEQIEIMIKNGELKEYARNSGEYFTNFDAEKELKEKEE